MRGTSLSVEGGLIAVPDPDAKGVRAFKGVPFAAPPVGKRRWRPPEAVKPWKGVRDTASYGRNAMQGVVFNDIDPTIPGVSEDCLYLNVWAPKAKAGARLPVLSGSMAAASSSAMPPSRAMTAATSRRVASWSSPPIIASAPSASWPTRR
jgi:para-nitrobenzyl esterase